MLVRVPPTSFSPLNPTLFRVSLCSSNGGCAGRVSISKQGWRQREEVDEAGEGEKGESEAGETINPFAICIYPFADRLSHGTRIILIHAALGKAVRLQKAQL